MFRRCGTTIDKYVFHSFLYDFFKVTALVDCIFEYIEVEQLACILNAFLRIHHQHRDQKIHEALRDLFIFEKLVRMWMVFEEIRVSRLHSQEPQVKITADRCMERWCSKSKNEEEYTQRKNVCRL